METVPSVCLDETKLAQEIDDERSKLSSDRMDISFGELINLYKDRELIIKPDYQRMFRWSNKQKTALIESILLSIPIPPIFVDEDKDGVWELIDGLQRTATVISFFGDLRIDTPLNYKNNDQINNESIDEENIPISLDNKWSLEQGGIIKSLEGFNVDTLPNKYKVNIKRAVCRVEILRGGSDTSMKYELFKRLNSGGSRLTPQEIRNAIYRGSDSQLNYNIEELSKNELFRKMTKLSINKLNELYDQELVLRFIAFSSTDDIDLIDEKMELYLNKFMEKIVKDESYDHDKYKDIFCSCMKLIYTLGNENIFRNEQNFFVPAWFEGVTVALSKNFDKYLNNTSLLQIKIDDLKKDSDFRRCSGSASNSRSRIRNRLKRAIAIFS